MSVLGGVISFLGALDLSKQQWGRHTLSQWQQVGTNLCEGCCLGGFIPSTIYFKGTQTFFLWSTILDPTDSNNFSLLFSILVLRLGSLTTKWGLNKKQFGQIWSTFPQWWQVRTNFWQACLMWGGTYLDIGLVTQWSTIIFFPLSLTLDLLLTKTSLPTFVIPPKLGNFIYLTWRVTGDSSKSINL
jgi:hypothetical protein